MKNATETGMIIVRLIKGMNEMKGKALFASLLICVVVLLLVSSCSGLLPKKITITNASSGYVTIKSSAFLDGTEETLGPGGSVTKSVNGDAETILVETNGKYFEKAIKTYTIKSNGSVTLEPDYAWIRLVNNSGSTISNASISTEDFKFDANGDETSTTVDDGSEIWLRATETVSGTLYFEYQGNQRNINTPCSSPDKGKTLVLTMNALTSILISIAG